MPSSQEQSQHQGRSESVTADPQPTGTGDRSEPLPPRDPEGRIQPNLLIIGAMKASTTLLYQLLMQHPRVWFPETKEPHFFSKPTDDDPLAWEAYLELFRPCPAGKTLVGEASTTYTRDPHCGPVPQRIHARLGRPKLVYILRDPLKRIESHYKHCVSIGLYRPDETLGDVIDRDPVIIDSTLYAHQLAAYRREFGDDAVHVLIAEELYADHPRVLADLARYLEIEETPAWREPLSEVNSARQLRTVATLGTLARRYPGLSRIVQRLPGPINQFAKRAALSVAPPAPTAPPIPERALERALELIAEDLKELRAWLGPRLDSWPTIRRLER